RSISLWVLPLRRTIAARYWSTRISSSCLRMAGLLSPLGSFRSSPPARGCHGPGCVLSGSGRGSNALGGDGVPARNHEFERAGGRQLDEGDEAMASDRIRLFRGAEPKLRAPPLSRRSCRGRSFDGIEHLQ